MISIILYFIIINILSFILYGFDKRLAIKRKDRVEEKLLFFVSFLGGGLGSLIGMKIFRHKTNKVLFWIINSISIFVWFIIIFKYLAIK